MEHELMDKMKCWFINIVLNLHNKIVDWVLKVHTIPYIASEQRGANKTITTKFRLTLHVKCFAIDKTQHTLTN